VNVKAAFFLSCDVAKVMMQQNTKGSIVNVASVAGIRPMRGIGAYSGASRFIVRRLAVVEEHFLLFLFSKLCSDEIRTNRHVSCISFRVGRCWYSRKHRVPGHHQNGNRGFESFGCVLIHYQAFSEIFWKGQSEITKMTLANIPMQRFGEPHVLPFSSIRPSIQAFFRPYCW
jgi:hypothetical protein